MELSEYNWANISETICPEMLIFGKQASWTLFYDPYIYHSVEVLATTNLHFFVPFLLETETVTKTQNQEKRNEGTITWKLCTIKQRVFLMGLY